MRIGVIGCGSISSAVVRGIAVDGHQITVSERSAHHAQALAAEYPNVAVATNQGVIDASELIFVALMAEVAPQVLGDLRFGAGQRVITFMAGATLQEVDALVRPARAVAIMMPFPAIAHGGSPIMMLGDVALIEALFGARNTVFLLKDAAEMAGYICAQAVLSPVARMVGAGADWLGKRGADPDQAEAFLRALVASSMSSSGCAALLDALNTPGGYNQRLRQHMEASGTTTALQAGLDALET